MHQPVDNFSHVVEKAIDGCYRPFFETMYRFPDFKFSVHCSGWLLEQIEMRRKSLFSLIREMSEAGIIEFLTSGYYEPVLSAIPSKDRRGQISMLSDYIQEKFSTVPLGLWLTERVWDDGIIPDVVASGIEYVLVDDYHFICAGFDRGELDGYYLTEWGGDRIAVFPISKELRYSIPFSMPEEALESLKGHSCAVIFDDAEKFGLWPETYEWVYGKGWLEKFVDMVVTDGGVETMHYRDYVREFKPLGVAYLPSASYYEMGEWCIKPESTLRLSEVAECVRDRFGEQDTVRFVRGGVWKSFLVKYSESNHMHKRMLELSLKQKKGWKFKKELYKSQTNDVFWHGIFGGLYLPNLRDNFFKHIIECENMLKPQPGIVDLGDFNLDGLGEVKLISEGEIFVFSSLGGQMIEFDVRDRGFNFQNTLTRRREFYHNKMINGAAESGDGISTIHSLSKVMEESLRGVLIYDWYDRHSFIDHITGEDFSPESFYRCSFREFGDFVNMPFEYGIKENGVVFIRDGGVYIMGDKYDTRVEKVFSSENGLSFLLRINTSYPWTLRYVCEFNLHFADPKEVLVNGRPYSNLSSFTSDRVFLEDPIVNKVLEISFSVSSEVYMFTVETVSQNERGFEKTAQGIALACAFDLSSSLELDGSIVLRDGHV